MTDLQDVPYEPRTHPPPPPAPGYVTLRCMMHGSHRADRNYEHINDPLDLINQF